MPKVVYMGPHDYFGYEDSKTKVGDSHGINLPQDVINRYAAQGHVFVPMSEAKDMPTRDDIVFNDAADVTNKK